MECRRRGRTGDGEVALTGGNIHRHSADVELADVANVLRDARIVSFELARNRKDAR